MQEVITYTLVVLAVLFLVKKFFLPSKRVKGCNTDCNCS